MKISLNWLSDFVDVNMAAEKLADRLMQVGFVIEEIVRTDDDIILDVEVTSNRPDLLGHIGMAREIAAAAGLAFRPPQIALPAADGDVNKLAAVEVRSPELCPRYTARVIRGVKIGPSPDWLVRRLGAVGLRSINNVVDVTNYILMEYSQPLHSFDYDKLTGQKIVVRRAAKGETLVSIDSTTCKLDESMLIIADANKPVAIAGVMGGLDTEVGDKTVNILLEAAQFDPLTTRRTSRKLALMSPSNYRFERGIDPVGIERASARACQMIVELAGGKIADGIIDVWPTPWRQAAVELRIARTAKILGYEIPVKRQAEILAALGLEPQIAGEKIICKIPPYRADLSREIDLIEEIARIEGFDKIPAGGKVTHTVVPADKTRQVRARTVQTLTACGMDEALTFSFADAKEAEIFGYPKFVAVDPLNRKTNNVLRPTIIPSLLRVCKTNQDAGADSVGVFELAAVFPPGAGELPDEHQELAMATTADFATLRGTVESLMEDLCPNAQLQIAPADVPGMTQGAAATIALAGKQIGVIGLASQEALNYYGLEGSIACAKLNFSQLIAAADLHRNYKPVPKFPSVKRDLSFIVDDCITWQQLSGEIAKIPQPMRADMQYVTTYRGKPISSSRKSVTVTLTYRSNDGTLRSEQVDEMIGQVVETMKKSLSAELRA